MGAAAFARPTEGDSPAEDVDEVTRVLRLPKWSPETFKDLDLTARLRAPGGTLTLRPVQSLALHMMERVGGLIAPIGVGGGKGPISMILPLLVKARRPVLFVPASLVQNFHREYRKFQAHFTLAKNLHIYTYSELSTAVANDLLFRHQPDLIIADEAQNFRHPDSARTRRLLRYAKAFPLTKYAFMSGSLTKSSLEDYAHLVELALGKGAPIPLEMNLLLSWAQVIDSNGRPRAADWHAIEPLIGQQAALLQDREAARGAFRRRFRSTMGVVGSDESDLDVGLVIRERKPAVPPVVAQAFRDLDQSWTRPDGEELATPLEKFRLESQLSQGFYYRWDWREGKVDVEWMDKRAAWHKSIRRILKCQYDRWDSPLRITHGLTSGELPDAHALAAYEDWGTVKMRPKPPTKAVWLHDFMVRDALAWAERVLRTKGGTGIIWFAHDAVGQVLAGLGLPTYFAGVEIPETSKNQEIICCSAASHGVGKNLQPWNHNLVLSWNTSGAFMEQLLGRTHRPGQLADDVLVDDYTHTRAARNALRRSKADAAYIEQSTGTKQKMNLATWVDASWAGEEEAEQFPEET